MHDVLDTSTARRGALGILDWLLQSQCTRLAKNFGDYYRENIGEEAGVAPAWEEPTPRPSLLRIKLDIVASLVERCSRRADLSLRMPTNWPALHRFATHSSAGAGKLADRKIVLT